MTTRNKEVIYIDKYVPEIVNDEKGQHIQVFAVKGKMKYPIPKAFEEMCNEKYLAIGKMSIEMPEVLDVPKEYYAPLRTDMND